MNARQLGPILGYMVLDERGRPMRKDGEYLHTSSVTGRASIFPARVAARRAHVKTWNHFEWDECKDWKIIRIYGPDGVQ